MYLAPFISQTNTHKHTTHIHIHTWILLFTPSSSQRIVHDHTHTLYPMPVVILLLAPPFSFSLSPLYILKVKKEREGKLTVWYHHPMTCHPIEFVRWSAGCYGDMLLLGKKKKLVPLTSWSSASSEWAWKKYCTNAVPRKALPITIGLHKLKGPKGRNRSYNPSLSMPLGRPLTSRIGPLGSCSSSSLLDIWICNLLLLLGKVKPLNSEYTRSAFDAGDRRG